MIHRGSLAALILALSVITGCGGGGGGNGSPQPPQPPTPPMDVQAPMAQILFPPAASATEASTITVRGTASDDGTVSAVRVNGVLATTSDAFATWQAVVPLVPGQNTLMVEAVDAANHRNAAAAQAVIARTAQLNQVGGLGVDAASNRAFVYDFKGQALFSVDLATGLRTLLFADPSPEDPSAIHIGTVKGILLDSAHNRVLVLDPSLSGIVAINLDTGMRTMLTGTGVPNNINQFVAPRDFALDEKRDRVLVIDSGAVFAVSLADGSRTVLPGNGTPDSANQLVNATGIVVDATNNRALVTDYRAALTGNGPNAVIAVNLTDGSRTLFSDASTPNDANPFPESDIADIAVDRQHNRLLVASRLSGVLTGVSLSDGSRSIVANTVFANAIEVDPSGNRALVVSSQVSGRSGLVAVNLDSGFASLFTDPSVPTGLPLGAPNDVIVDPTSNRLLVLDAQFKRVISINMGQGAERSVFSQLPATDAANAPFAMALDRTNKRVLVTRDLPDAVAIDLATGAASVLPSSGIGMLRGLAVDDSNRRVFLNEASSFGQQSSLVQRFLFAQQPPPFDQLFSFDGRLLTADLSDPLGLSPAPLVSGPPLILLSRLAFDATSERLLATDFGRVLAISPSNPTPVAFVAAPGAGGNSFLTGIALDTAANQALVADLSTRSVLAVSLADGSFSTVVSGLSGPNALAGPEGLALDSATGRIFVADFQAGTVFVIDRVTGERVFL